MKMVVLDKNEKTLLDKQGWIIIDNTILLKDIKTNVVEFVVKRDKHDIRKLIQLTRQSCKPDQKLETYNNVMCDIVMLEKKLELYD